MKDRTPKAASKIELLADKLVTTIVTVLSDSIKTATDTAGALIAFSTAAAKLGFAAEVPDAHASQLADALSVKLGWNGTPREKVNKSEARAIIRQHAQIPELVVAMRAKYGKCGYHDAVKVCRLIPKCDNDLGKAVKQFGVVPDAKATDYNANAMRAIKSLYAATRDARKTDKRTSELKLILGFAAEMGWDLG
jgi:hypothetical protein